MGLLAPILLAATLASPAPCATIDLMPQFWRFWERARGADAAEQYRLFEELVRKPNAAVYEGIFGEVPKPPSEFVPTALARLPELETRMRELSARLTRELPGELEAFRTAFPRFRCSVPVYFVFSAGAFDGATREVSGATALMFGLDVIARLKEELSPLVVHELFHVYHEQAVPEDPETVSWALWAEGLASYVSRRLNPNVPEKDICCIPPLDAADVSRVAAELTPILDSKDRKVYARYFLGGQPIDIPARSGYAVGYRIAAEAGKTRTLEELAALGPDEVRAIEDEALRHLAAPPAR